MREEFRRFHTDDRTSVNRENPMRAVVAQQVDEFIAAGGKIEVVPSGCTGWVEGRYGMGFDLNLPNGTPRPRMDSKKK